MPGILEKLKTFFSNGGALTLLSQSKKSTTFAFIKTNEDPNETWSVIDNIGDGAFGQIFKVQHKESGIYAALKQVNIEEESDLGLHCIEIDILSQFHHVNVVGLHEAFYFEGKLWMYLEFCAVGAVDGIMQELEKPLTEPQIQCVSQQMCKGIEFLHNNNIIHRDIKAGNVLLTVDGTVKLADFGVSAKNSDSSQKRNTYIGSPYWMAPEVIACETVKDTPYDNRADIWSFGITLIEFAQMEPPFNKMNPARVLLKILRGDPPTLDLPRNWSSEFNLFISKCLQKEPNQRPSASELLQQTFFSLIKNNQPIIELISEAKAEVLIEVTDLDSRDINLELTHLSDSDTQSAEMTLDSTPTTTLSKEPSAASTKRNSIPNGFTGDLGRSNIPENNKESRLTENHTAIVHYTAEPSKNWRRKEEIPDIPVRNGKSRHEEEVQDKILWNNKTRNDQEDLINGRTRPNEEVHRNGKTRSEEEVLRNGKTRSEEEVLRNGKTRSDDEVLRNDKTRQIEEEVQEMSMSVMDDSLDDDDFRIETNGPSKNWSNGSANVKDGLKPGLFGAMASRRFIGQTQEQANAVSLYQDGQTPTSSAEPFRRERSQYKSLTKTRRYVYEGKVMTSQTSRVVISGEENREQQDRQTRRANLRALQLLQISENRQQQELRQLFSYQMEQLDKQFDLKLRECLKAYTADCERLAREQKQEIEKLESRHMIEYRTLERNLRLQQDKDRKIFRANLKRELKLVKQDKYDDVPKHLRRDYHLRRIEQKEIENEEIDRTFGEQQREALEKAKHRLQVEQRSQMAAQEAELLAQKHQLLRACEGSLWELEEKRLRERTGLLQVQLRKMFDLQLQQTKFRHSQEMEHIRRSNEQDLIKLQQKQMVDRKELAKVLKSETRARLLMFRETLKMSRTSLEEEREKARQHDVKERQRIKHLTERQEKKHARQTEDLRQQAEACMADMEQLHMERQRELRDQLEQKLKDETNRYNAEVADWQYSLSSRKRVLEEEFDRQRAEQDLFYNQSNGLQLRSSDFSRSTPDVMGCWINSDSHISTTL